MKNSKEIKLEEQKKIRFYLLEELDKFCNDSNIKYSLSFGTLLGAVRHKGFIPWDDDLDIMMPLPDMLRFKKEFKSDNIKFCDIDTEPHYRCLFANLVDNSTYRKNGLVYTFMGVGIDIYPIIGIPDNEQDRNAFFDKISAFQNKREKYLKWNSRVTRYLPVPAIPGFDHTIKSYRDFVYNCSVPYDEAKLFCIISGNVVFRRTNYYNSNYFDKLIELPFEGKKFKCIEKYNDFLSFEYGDFMKLPPIDERITHHGQTYYWK